MEMDRSIPEIVPAAAVGRLITLAPQPQKRTRNHVISSPFLWCFMLIAGISAEIGWVLLQGEMPFAVFCGGDSEPLAEDPAEVVAVGKTTGQGDIRNGQVLLPQLLHGGVEPNILQVGLGRLLVDVLKLPAEVPFRQVHRSGQIGNGYGFGIIPLHFGCGGGHLPDDLLRNVTAVASGQQNGQPGKFAEQNRLTAGKITAVFRIHPVQNLPDGFQLGSIQLQTTDGGVGGLFRQKKGAKTRELQQIVADAAHGLTAESQIVELQLFDPGDLVGCSFANDKDVAGTDGKALAVDGIDGAAGQNDLQLMEVMGMDEVVLHQRVIVQGKAQIAVPDHAGKLYILHVRIVLSCVRKVKAAKGPFCYSDSVIYWIQP